MYEIRFQFSDSQANSLHKLSTSGFGAEKCVMISNENPIMVKTVLVSDIFNTSGDMQYHLGQRFNAVKPK
jgi:hypothetical protein